MMLAACGGGGEGEPGGEPPPGQYSAQQRSAATGRIAERFEELAAAEGPTAATWERLRAWVVAQPEFDDAGVGDQLLWARFTDGRYFMFTDNWHDAPVEPPVAPDRGRATSPVGGLPRPAAAANVPVSEKALILSMKGDGEFDSNAAMLAQMDKVLTGRGWDVAPDRLLDVQSLKDRGSLGFLFVTTHSGMFGPTDREEFAFMLDTQVSVLNEATHQADLDAGRLIYHRDRTTWQRFGFGRNPRYAATVKFVDEYLTFSPGSLVILLSCDSGSPMGAGFRAALMRKGAGTIIGWENNSSPNAYATVNVLMDRLSGQNEVRRVTPANRPFNLDDVWTFLGKNDLLVNEAPEAPPGKPPYKEAYVRRFGAGPAVLGPIIHSVQATGEKLTVHGEFGSVPGTLTVGGAGVAVARWTPDRIEAVLANGTHGEVVVTTNQRRSNKRVLASWRTQVVYQQEEEAVQNCNGAKFHNTVSIDLHVRADAHAVRTEVDGPLKNNSRVFVVAPDTRATWTADGNCTIGGRLHTRWSGSGAFPFNTDFDFENPSGPPTGNILLGRVDAIEQRFQLTGLFGHDQRHTVTTFLAPPALRPVQIDVDLVGFRNRKAGELPYGTYIPFSASQVIAADEQVRTNPRDGHSVKVRWGAASPTPAFDDDVAR
ncbi:MAG: hypothetical protein K0R58_635 [Ramlibacter sp.]|nr:hypothetical protein [Ramlibacter sp.]